MSKEKFKPENFISDESHQIQNKSGNLVIRPNALYNYISTMGKSKAKLDCPFCGLTATVYIWSLSGSGKRCECGALHCNGNTFVSKELYLSFKNSQK